MKLIEYKNEDAKIITSWIKDEISLYKWSADRIQKFPIEAKDLNECYKPLIESANFIPLSFIDNDSIIGHLIIRYPENNNKEIVRFGFVIIASQLRGQGIGKQMLNLAIKYAKNNLNAKKITLGVFSNNLSAKYCYESVGFKETGIIDKYPIKLGEWDCIEMELEL